MRAARIQAPVALSPIAAGGPETETRVLREIISELAERVELLETRERLARAGCAPTSRHRSRA